MVPWDLLGVPRVPILGPNCGMFSKLIGPGPLGSGVHSHTSFSNGRFRDTYTSFHIDVCGKPPTPSNPAQLLAQIFAGHLNVDNDKKQ